MNHELYHTSIIKKQSHDYELIAMAYHEGGHAVCALHNFMKVFNVSVMNSITAKDKGGNTEYILYDVDSVDDELLKRILLIFELQTSYAGLIAEKMYYKDICGSDNFPMHLRIGSSADIKCASSIIKKYDLAKSGKNRFLFKKQTQSDVEDILIEHWDAIKVIAHSLYKKKRLSFDDLKYLLTRKTENKDFWKDRFKKLSIVHSEKNLPDEKSIKSLILEDAIFSV